MDPNFFLTCFLSYVVCLTAFGWWMSRRKQSGEDFLLGGRSLPFFLTLGTTIATMVGTGSSMGAVGKGYSSGWAGSFYGIGGTIGILLTAWLFAATRKHRFMTMAEELASYAGASRSVSGVVGIFSYLACVGWLGLHILGGGKYLEFATKIDPALAKTCIALGFAIYAMMGGYLAVVWTDSVQAIVLFVGFVLTAFFAFDYVGGWEGMQQVNAELEAKGDGSTTLGAVSLIVVIAVGVLGNPCMRQRIYSGNSVPEIRKAFVTSGILYLGFAILPAIIGMAAYKGFPNLSNQDLAFPTMATEMLPAALGIVILLAGLSATMSSASSDAVAAVATFVRDLYQLAFGRVPAAERVVWFSRLAMAITTGLALGMALVADNVIGYIKVMIPLFISGMCVCGILGRFWTRYNAAGAMATLLGACVTSVAIMIVPEWENYWEGQPVIPALCVSTALGILVSVLTKPDGLSRSEALEALAKERGGMEG